MLSTIECICEYKRPCYSMAACSCSCKTIRACMFEQKHAHPTPRRRWMPSAHGTAVRASAGTARRGVISPLSPCPHHSSMGARARHHVVVQILAVDVGEHLALDRALVKALCVSLDAFASFVPRRRKHVRPAGPCTAGTLNLTWSSLGGCSPAGVNTSPIHLLPIGMHMPMGRPGAASKLRSSFGSQACAKLSHILAKRFESMPSLTESSSR